MGKRQRERLRATPRHAPDEVGKPVEPALELLACKQCSAPIPFGDEALTTCPFCGTETEVPAAYREMRASRVLDAVAREKAERLLVRLDRPPRLATKVLARMFDFHLLAFMLAYAVPLIVYDAEAMLRFADWIAPRLGKRTGDEVPPWIPLTFAVALLLVLVFLPRVLGIYANRRASARRQLLSALAAKPPATPRGPARCRACSAPLSVEAGKLLAVCAYCGTENALRLQTTLVAAVASSARRLARTVEQVAEIDRAEKRHTRVQLLRELFRYVWPTAIFASALIFTDQPTIGPILTSLAALLLIGLALLSLARSVPGKGEAQQRRTSNDVPGWVAALGPVLVWSFYIWGPLL